MRFARGVHGALFFAVVLALLCGSVAAHAQGAEEERGDSSEEVIFPGKLYCSLTRPVLIPLPGIVKELRVNTGQKVKQGEVLMRLELMPEDVDQLEATLERPDNSNWEYRLFEVEAQLAEYEEQREAARKMVEQQMAPQKTLDGLNKTIELLQKKISMIKEQFVVQRNAYRERVEALKERLDLKKLSSDHVPRVLDIRSPLEGHVLAIDPAVRPGSLVPKGPVLSVGLVDPMIIRAQVFEREVSQLKEGGQMRFWLESSPDKIYSATISRIGWTPINPAFDRPSYYEVELLVSNSDAFLREGFKVLVSY